jgi:hypothetical protein
MTTTDREQYTITLRAEPGFDVPAVVRLRKFLKEALRGWGLRCVEAREVGGDDVQQDGSDGARDDDTTHQQTPMGVLMVFQSRTNETAVPPSTRARESATG